MPSFAARAPRCTIANVDTGESIACLFNPAQLTEKLQANWNHRAVPGLSHQALQYQGTGNRQLSGAEFYVDRLFASRSGNEAHVGEFAAFLRALFIWPKLLTLECIVGSVEFSYRQCGADGAAMVYVATVSFEEVLDVRVTSAGLRAVG